MYHCLLISNHHLGSWVQPFLVCDDRPQFAKSPLVHIPCTTAVYHNDATYHNQRNLSQQVTQHVTIDAKDHNSNAKCHNAKYHTNFDFFCNMSHVFAQNEECHMEIVKFK